jgi:hypothetical protein
MFTWLRQSVGQLAETVPFDVAYSDTCVPYVMDCVVGDSPNANAFFDTVSVLVAAVHAL